MIVGVLALQGAFAAHHDRLADLGVEVREVRVADQLTSLDGLVIPGGESTTMSHLLRTNDLFDPIAAAIADGPEADSVLEWQLDHGVLLIKKELGKTDEPSLLWLSGSGAN